MITLDAIIAPTVNPKQCDYRQYLFHAIYASNSTMEKIDRHWIKARLSGTPRGTQTRLAEHLGIESNVMSKIMTGVRDLQQDEIPKVLTFFNARIITEDQLTKDRETVLRGARRLNKDGLLLLQKQLDQMLQMPALVQPSENSEQEQPDHES